MLNSSSNGGFLARSAWSSFQLHASFTQLAHLRARLLESQTPQQANAGRSLVGID